MGGAGYIGSHTAKRLSDAGFLPDVFDDLSAGREDFVKWGPLERGSIRDSRGLLDVLLRHKPHAVIHRAARARVENRCDPAPYYPQNVGGALKLLEAMRFTGVHRLVFSSTCAVYGLSERPRITEADLSIP